MNVQQLRDSLAGLPPELPVYLLQAEGPGPIQPATMATIESVEPIESDYYGKAVVISIEDDQQKISQEEIGGKLLHLMDGLDNCIASAKLNGDSYGEGYMGAMAKELKEVFLELGGQLEDEEA
ncbi:MAG TPA: hypothetical protein VJ576_09670 [Rhodocyclaceae bacterium]|nr:hypothetical protein [Rhodocyclaceae bacterium]